MIRLSLGSVPSAKPGWVDGTWRAGAGGWRVILRTDVERASVATEASGETFDDESVDVITAFDGLEHVTPESLPAACAELRRILKPHGIVRIAADGAGGGPSRSDETRRGARPAIVRTLAEAGFRAYEVTGGLTLSSDKSTLAPQSGARGLSAGLFVEGIKPDTTTGASRPEAVVQRALAEALRYLLHGSLTRFPNAFPFSRRPLNGSPLHGLCGVSGSSRVPEGEYAERLAGAYATWEGVAKRAGLDDGRAGVIPVGRTYREWLDRGGNSPRYAAVHQLRTLLAERGSEFFVRSCVHGSVATLDDVSPFSDLDLAFIIRSTVLRDPAQLIRLRRLAADILTLTYLFDPFMHHGPAYLAECDLAFYPESTFPSLLFAHGTDLDDEPREVQMRVRASQEVTDDILAEFQRFFATRAARPFTLRNAYELQWLLGTAMLLPALYLQRTTGVYRYKRETFAIARGEFDPDVWEPMEIATQVRDQRGPRPRVPPTIAGLARRLAWPGLIQRWAVRRPEGVRRATEASTRLGSDYARCVLRLVDAMRARIDGRAPARLRVSYFDDLVHAPRTDLPMETSAETYDEAIALAVARWTTAPRPPTAIYQIGQVAAPGLSDLDFVVVFSDDARVSWSRYQPETFPEWARRLITHPPYLSSESAWRHLPGWYPVFDLRHLWGRRLPKPQLAGSVVPGCALGMLVDYLIRKIPFDVVRIAWERPLRVRTLLALLHSAKYLFRLAESAGLERSTGSETFVREVDDLRTSWFRLEPTRQAKTLGRLCDEACDVVAAQLRVVEDLVGAGARAGAAHAWGDVEFLPQWTIGGALSRSWNVYSRSGRFVWSSPAALRRVFWVYADESRALARHLRLRSETGLRWDGDRFDEGLRYHARAMELYGYTAARLGVPGQRYVALGWTPPLPRALRYARQILKREISLLEVGRRAAKAGRGLLTPR